ncbi:MAG: hypothetical protein ACTSU6_04025 [Candidatus Njordarchaeales archaeon]
MKSFKLLILALLLSGCVTETKYTTITKYMPHTYLKFSGYVQGCADIAQYLIMELRPDMDPSSINMTVLDATCLELYMLKLEEENIKPPMKRFDRNEMI